MCMYEKPGFISILLCCEATGSKNRTIYEKVSEHYKISHIGNIGCTVQDQFSKLNNQFDSCFHVFNEIGSSVGWALTSDTPEKVWCLSSSPTNNNINIIVLWFVTLSPCRTSQNVIQTQNESLVSSTNYLHNVSQLRGLSMYLTQPPHQAFILSVVSGYR